MNSRRCNFHLYGLSIVTLDDPSRLLNPESFIYNSHLTLGLYLQFSQEVSTWLSRNSFLQQTFIEHLLGDGHRKRVGNDRFSRGSPRNGLNMRIGRRLECELWNCIAGAKSLHYNCCVTWCRLLNFLVLWAPSL